MSGEVELHRESPGERGHRGGGVVWERHRQGHHRAAPAQVSSEAERLIL